MSPSGHRRFRIRQAGLGLVGAIFVIVVVSLLSVAMSRMLETDQTNQSYEMLSLKAFLAAESGAQLGVNRVLPPAGGGVCAPMTFNFDDFSLKSCRADVSCVTLVVGTDTYYTLTSSGICQAGSFTTQRSVEVRVAAF